MNEYGFRTIAHEFVNEQIRASFQDLPADPYCPGRYRRFSQYHLTYMNGGWQPFLLPPRPHIQSRGYNKYVGGQLRHFAPLKIDSRDIIAFVALSVDLPQEQVWHVDVHQWRTACLANEERSSVPEGPHQDGHHIGAILVVDRHGIRGGETLVYQPPSHEVLFHQGLTSGTGLVFDDRRVFHNTTEIQAGPAGGNRDVFVLDFNPWEERRYGQEFERQALGEPVV